MWRWSSITDMSKIEMFYTMLREKDWFSNLTNIGTSIYIVLNQLYPS